MYYLKWSFLSSRLYTVLSRASPTLFTLAEICQKLLQDLSKYLEM